MASANLDRANLTGANVAGAVFREASLVETTLTGASFQNTDLCGANLTGAELTNTNFKDATYDLNTVFDSDVDPISLGMKTLEETQATQSPLSDVSIKVNEPQTQQPESKKTKEIWYRGSRTLVEIEETSRASEESTVKEIWYRGTRTIVETKAADSSAQPELNYRGVKSSQ